MIKQSLLKEFEYSIPAPTVPVFDKLKTNGVAKHLSLFKLKIDFVAGNLNLEGYRNYMTITDFHEGGYLINTKSGKLKIETVIYPATTINLNEPETDGMIFLIEGHIKNDNRLLPCAGFLVIDKTTTENKYLNERWNISCYIFDIPFTDFEINFKLPLSIDTFNIIS